MDLITIDQVKPLLDIPLADTSRDAEVTLAMTAAQNLVVRRTRYSITATAIVDEVHERVHAGDTLYTNLRPIDPDTLVIVVRYPNQATRTAVEFEVIDAAKGQIRIVSPNDTRPWPPRAFDGFMQRSRRSRFPLVLVSYETVEPSGLEDLSQVTAAFAAYLVTTGPGGATAGREEAVGQVTVKDPAVMTGAPSIPALYEALISPHVWPKGYVR